MKIHAFCSSKPFQARGELDFVSLICLVSLEADPAKYWFLIVALAFQVLGSSQFALVS